MFNQRALINLRPGFCLILFLLTSCGPKIIPDEFEAKIDKSLSFEMIIQNPEPHIGKRILVGGEIIETHVYQDGSEIEILQKPLDSGRVPRFTDKSLGRFFLRHTTFLDPEIYKSGRRITVVGVVQGSKARQIAQAIRTYPILENDYHRLWPYGSGYNDDHSLRFHFGFGAIFSR